MTRALAFILISILCLPSLLFCQSASEAQFRNLPVWPPDGKIPTAMKGTYVFRDTATEEIVISFPTHPDQPDGPRTTYRYRPQNQVEAGISVDFEPANEGTYRYRYTVRNGSTARLAISDLTIVVPPNSVLKAGHPRWRGVPGHGPKATMKQAGLPGAPPGSFVLWGTTDKNLRILPGSMASDFVLLSSYRPGLTTLYVSGGDGFMTSGGDLPVEVGNQFIPFLRPEVNRQVVLTLGPRFGPDASQKTITLDYREGLRHLVERNILPKSSQFVQKLTKFLDQCGKEEENPCLKMPQSEFLHEKHGGMEGEIARSLLLALR